MISHVVDISVLTVFHSDLFTVLQVVYRVPEKEFLLVHTHLVQTNKNRIESHDHQDTWICKGYLISIATTIFNRPRLRIHHVVWDPHIGGAEDGNAVLPIPVHSWIGQSTGI